MTSFERLAPGSDSPGVTCLIVTAGIGIVETIERIHAEMACGAVVRVVATPVAARWMADGGLLQQIEDITGAPMEHEYRNPWEPKPSLMFNRCVIAPLTLNTLTKWADGHADNLALAMLCEAAWTRGVEVTAHLTLNGAYKHHPAAKRAIDVLNQAGVEMVPFVGGEKLRGALASYGANQIPDELSS